MTNPWRIELYDGSVIQDALEVGAASGARGPSLYYPILDEAWASGGLPLLRTTGDSPTGDPFEDAGWAHAANALQVLIDRFGYNGFSAQPLRVIVHTPDEYYPFPFAVRHGDHSILFGDALTRDWQSLVHEPVVVAHEIVHLVESRLRANSTVDSAVPSVVRVALGECWADVLAKVIYDDGDWKIGHLRDLSDPLIASLDDVEDPAAIEPHDLSGIPSLAAVRVAEKVGVKAMGNIWFAALRDHRSRGDDFPAAARATILAARDLGIAESIVENAWESVTITPAAYIR